MIMNHNQVNIQYNSQSLLFENFKCTRILKNIKKLVHNSKKSYKKSLLSICSPYYPLHLLKKIGFKISNTLYKNSQNDKHLIYKIFQQKKV